MKGRKASLIRLTEALFPALLLLAPALYPLENGLPTDLSGSPNPDPKAIQGAPGAETIEIAPRNDELDARNLQWAVDNVAAGGTLSLGEGTFFLGDDKKSPKQTVLVRQGLRVVGIATDDGWKTVIRGGGTLGCGPRGIESGAFRIRNETDPHAVVFENLWLRDWTAEAVCIEAVQGFVFRHNRLSHPVNTAVEGQIRFVHALWTTGVRARGDFIAENNLVELGGYDGALADDEQFMGVFFSNHDTIRITDNTIIGIDEAIELIGNRVGSIGNEGATATGPSEVFVTGNTIDVTQQPGERWPSTVAILVAGNLGAEAVHIENNELVVRGPGYAFGVSGDRLRIAGNRVRFEEFEGSYPAGVMTIGYGELSGRPMGSSLNDSVFEDNTFEGKVRQVGILFRGRGPGYDSHGNRFDLGNSLAKLGAKTTLSLSEAVHDNVFTGDLGTVQDASKPGSNQLGQPATER